MDCRVILDKPRRGTLNMAVDEALLTQCPATQATLRFYRWSEPTLSLGYFQSYGDRNLHAASRSCPLVRRSSGGGAILHHHELTYSFICPVTDRLSAAIEDVYDFFHLSLIDTLGEWSIQAESCPGSGDTVKQAEPFLCFQRRAKGDVLVEGNKVCGSAQRRRRGAMVQHGSILLGRSEFAPELAGATDITGRSVIVDQFIEAWLKTMEVRNWLRFTQGGFTSAEREAAEEIENTKFAASSWSMKR